MYLTLFTIQMFVVIVIVFVCNNIRMSITDQPNLKLENEVDCI